MDPISLDIDGTCWNMLHVLIFVQGLWDPVTYQSSSRNRLGGLSMLLPQSVLEVHWWDMIQAKSSWKSSQNDLFMFDWYQFTPLSASDSSNLSEAISRNMVDIDGLAPCTWHLEPTMVTITVLGMFNWNWWTLKSSVVVWADCAIQKPFKKQKHLLSPV